MSNEGNTKFTFTRRKNPRGNHGINNSFIPNSFQERKEHFSLTLRLRRSFLPTSNVLGNAVQCPNSEKRTITIIHISLVFNVKFLGNK